MRMPVDARPQFLKSHVVLGMKYRLGRRKIHLYWLWILVALIFGSNVIFVEWFIQSKSFDLGTRSSLFGSPRSNDQRFLSLSKATELLISSSGTRSLVLPSAEFPQSQTPSFGWLNISFAESRDGKSQPTSLARLIKESDEEGGTNDNDDDDSTEHAIDEHHDNEDRCQDTSFVKKNHRPNCNSFQELGMQELIRADLASFLDAGSLTDVFAIVDQGDHTQTSKFVFKGIKFRKKRDLSYSAYKRALRDAMLSSAVGRHPLIVSNFGYCGFYVLGEYVSSGTVESLAWSNDPFCKKHGNGRDSMNLEFTEQQPLVAANNLTVTQKLRFSLDMAEALALLHNHKDGVLVHGDVWMAQFLLDETQAHVRLNDFNNGEIMQFNPHRQEYCPFQKRFGEDYGVAPEETSGVSSGEARDVYRLGDNMYYLLTGHDLFPTICGDAKKYRMLAQGKTSFLDPRWKHQSFGEGAVADLISQCWALNPRDRPSIGAIVRQLRFVLKRHLEHEQHQ